MDFKIEREEFLKGLSRIQSIVEKKVAMPILSNALIETKPTGILITATDLEIGLQGFCPAHIEKEGKATASAKKLYEVVKELSEREVTCRLRENQWIEILCGKSNFKILGLAAESFPSLPTYEEEGFVDIKAHPFREMIEKTIYAVSNDETRYNLRGLFLIQQENESGKGLRMVATDGYRISMVDRNFDQEMKGLEKGILLPRKGMAELNRLIDEGAETIKIKIKNNNFIVRKDSVVLIMRLLDAEFPDYQQVIPVKTKRQIRMRREKFLEALRRVALLSSEKTRGVKFHFSKDTLELSSYNPEIGEAKEELAVDFKGEDMVVGFNSRFGLEALGTFGAEEVALEMDDEKSPSIFRPLNDAQHTCVVMPMRI